MYRVPKHRFALGVLAFALALLVGCKSQEQDQHYTLHGRVISKSAETGQLTVSHDKIPGFMDAMTMSYPVKDSDGLNNVQPGDQITADVIVHDPSNFWLEHLAITDTSGRGAVSVTPASALQAGQKAPNVAMTNQDGKVLHFAQWKGKAVLVTFIYTRCPLPTFCPLISSEFAAINKELKQSPADYKKTHLVSVSIDPSNDTPPVMRKYGLAYLEGDSTGFQHWDFVSTSPGDLKALATAFGLEYYEQENQIAHTMSTVLIGPDGTVAKSWPGNEWKTSDVLAAMRQAASGS